VVAALDNSGLQALQIDRTQFNKTFDLPGFAKLRLDNIEAGYKRGHFFVELDGTMTPTHSLLAGYKKKVPFKGLRVYKSDVKFAGYGEDWHSADGSAMIINTANVTLEEYGLGIYRGGLWFGLKGPATYLGNELNLTAKIFQNGSSEISDLGFAGLNLDLGKYTLNTTAQVVDGHISGEGSVNVGFLAEYVPAALQDPLTGDVKVHFENLGVDLDNKKIISGAVTLPFTQPLTPDFNEFSAVIRTLTLGFDKATVDGEIILASLENIDLPSPVTGLSCAAIDVSPEGLVGVISHRSGRQSITVPVITGNYGVNLLLSEFSLTVNSTKTESTEKVRLTALDGSIGLGLGYGLVTPVTNLRMLAGGAITWGVSSASGKKVAASSSEARGGKGESLSSGAPSSSGLSFTIPGTSFKAESLTGRLNLRDKSMEAWGNIGLPAAFGGGSVALTSKNALLFSARGLSTRSQVEINPDVLGSDFKLAGFVTDVRTFSFRVADNTVSGIIAAKMKLSPFDNLPISVEAILDNNGMDTLNVTAEELNETFHLAGFAELSLTKINIDLNQGRGKMSNNSGVVTLDGSLTLNNRNITGLGRSFAFSNLSVSPTTLSLPDGDLTKMYTANGDQFAVDKGRLAMSLNQYGFTVKDNLFWIALAGDVSTAGGVRQSRAMAGTVEQARARVAHNGIYGFELLTAEELTLAIGPDFELRGSFEHSDGHISTVTDARLYLGDTVMAAFPDGRKNAYNELPLGELSDLDFAMIGGKPTLTGGTITYAPGGLVPLTFPDLMTASFTSLTLEASAGGAVSTEMDGLTIDFVTGILAGFEPSDFTISNIGLTGGGLTGHVAWAVDAGEYFPVVPNDEHFEINALFTELAVDFDTSAETVTTTDVTGHLAFGTGYDATDLKPAIDFDATNGYSFMPSTKPLTLAGDLKLQDFSGIIDFEEQSLTLSGGLVIPFVEGGQELVLSASNWKITADGFPESPLVDTNKDLSQELGFNQILMTDADINFENFSLSNANVDLGITMTQLKNLKIASKIAVSETGTAGWSIDKESAQNLKYDIWVADLTITEIDAKFDAGIDATPGRGLYFSLETGVAIKWDGWLDFVDVDLTLAGLEVSNTGIIVDPLKMNQSVPGGSVKLAGVGLTLKKLQVGYDNPANNEAGRFYLHVAGGLEIGPIKGDAAIWLYDDEEVTFTEIALAYTNTPVFFEGKLKIKDGGLYADVQAKIAGMMTVNGSFIIGSTDTYTYWGVSLSGGGGSGIPLVGVPLSIYEIGGGFAYNMTVDQFTGKLEKAANNPFVLSAIVGLGTLDGGFTWYGKFKLNIENSKVSLGGDTWFLTNERSGTALHADITMGWDPGLFHVAAQANYATKMGDLTILKVTGGMDILFAENDWHMWFGSQDQRINVTGLQYLKGSGYLQLDSDGLAFGVRTDFNLPGEAWIFYGRVYGGAEVEMEGGFSPIYIDARGRIWVGLEAGVKAFGEKYEIISAHAELAARFRTPNPTFVMLHGEMRYSFFSGAVSGNWDMDFTMPESAEGADMDADIAAMPLLAYVDPQPGATDVGRVRNFEVRTTLPLMTPFEYDDGQWYVLGLAHYQWGGFTDLSQQSEANRGMTLNGQSGPLEGGLAGIKSLKYHYAGTLGKGEEYTIGTTLVLRHFTPGEPGGDYGLAGQLGPWVKEEIVTSSFTTTSDAVNMRELIRGGYPSQSTTPVYPGTAVYLEMNNPLAATLMQWFVREGQLRLDLVDPSGQAVAGQWNFTSLVDEEFTGTKRKIFTFTPDAPLELLRSYQNDAGEIRYARPPADGVWLNPFITAAETDEATSDDATTDGSGLSFASSSTVASASTQQTDTDYQQTGNTTVSLEASEYNVAVANKYTIELVDTRDENKLYGSKFFLTIPDEGGASFADSGEVIEQGGVLDAHFYANYSLDQPAYKEAVAEGYETFMEGRCALWDRFIAGEFAMDPDPEHICSMMNSYVYGMAADPRRHIPCSLEEAGENVYDYNLRVDEELNKCASAAAARAALDSQWNDTQEQQAEALATVDFRTIELRFSTTAPLNWNEIELEIVLQPHFNGDVHYSLPPVALAQHELCNSAIFASSNVSFTVGGHRWGCSDAIPSHTLQTLPRLTLTKDNYRIKSRRDGLDHRLELKLQDLEVYDSGTFLRVIDLHKSLGASPDYYGTFGIYERSITPSTTGSGSTLGRGTMLGQGTLTELRSPRSEADGFQSVNHHGDQGNSDLCAVCQE
jgi:hypothetical protein